MHSKENHQQNEKKTYKMEKIFANVITDKGLVSKIYKQLIQLYEKNKQLNLKMGKNTWIDIFFQRRHTNGQHEQEKMLNIANHQRNANQNHSETSHHTFQNGSHQKDYKLQMLVRIWRKGNPCTLLMGMYIGAAIMENRMEVPQKTKNKTSI